jgi:hypothetical protein
VYFASLCSVVLCYALFLCSLPHCVLLCSVLCTVSVCSVVLYSKQEVVHVKLGVVSDVEDK